MKIYVIAIYIFNFHLIFITCDESRLVSKLRNFYDKRAKNNRSNVKVTDITRTSLLRNDNELDKFIKDIDPSDLEELLKKLTTLSLTRTKTTTVELLTNEPDYIYWSEPGATFVRDDIVTRTSHNVSNTRENLKAEKLEVTTKKDFNIQNQQESEMKYSIQFDIKNSKTLKPHLPTSEIHLTSAFTTEKDIHITHKHHIHKTTELNRDYKAILRRPVFPLLQKESNNFLQNPNFAKVDREIQSPPWVKYEPMQLRDETGHKISLDEDMPDIQSRFVYPQSRKRWWWEYGKHYMHWYFWHCKNWIVHWKKNPPGALKSDLNMPDIQDDATYKTYKQNFYFNFCTWLLSSDKTNAEEIRFKSAIEGLFKSEEKQDTKPALRSSYTAKCYYCGRIQNERVRPTRICHRAFTDLKYLKFRHYLRSVCHFERRNDFVKSPLQSTGYITFKGRYYTNMCITHFTDVGELYTDRGCRRQIVPKTIYTDQVYVQSAYDTLDLILTKTTNETTCVATPYSQFVPFSRSKSGLFVRSYACICTGEFCNSSCRFFYGLPRFIILYAICLILIPTSL